MAGLSDPDGLIAGKQALDEQRKKAEALQAEVEALAGDVDAAATAAANQATALATAAATLAEQKLAEISSKIAELESLAAQVEAAFAEHREKEEAAARKKLEEADPSSVAKGIIDLALSTVPAVIPGAIPVCPAANTSAEKTTAALAAAKVAKADSIPKVAAAKKDALIKRAIERIAAQRKFTLRYLLPEMESIVRRGRELGLDDKTIEDLIFIGSRNDEIDNSTIPPTVHVKQIDAATMMIQMANHAETILPRGYPYRFDNPDEFKEFSNDLVGAVAAQGLDTSNIKIQGSSLRKTAAKDVDIAVFVSKQQFADTLAEAFQGEAREGKKGKGPALPLTGKSHEELKVLAAQIQANPNAYNYHAKTFAHAMTSGLINSEGERSPAKVKDIYETIKGKYGEGTKTNVESVSIAIADGAFDLKPAMTVRRT